MKCLFIITGRGIGGDSMISLNTIKALEKKGVKCEVALDSAAHDTMFDDKGYKWHRISVPQAGGHAATKISTIKAAFRLIKASFKARSLIKKLDVDFVVGVLGGGAIVGSVGAKLARKPAYSLISTPLDSFVCPKLNKCYILPELNIFKWDKIPKNTDKSFYPLAEDVGSGDAKIALEKLKEYPIFDENKKTIVFSSDSSIFKGVLNGLKIFSDYTDEYNLVLVGRPLKEEYLDLVDENKVIFAGYINWINHLFTYADLSVLTDDGVILAEALTCKTPIVALTKVKWGRYHNMADVFKGAIIESEVEDVVENVNKAFDTMDSLQERALYYADICSNASDDLADKMLKGLK